MIFEGSFKIRQNMLGLVAHIINPSTWEARVGRPLWVEDQPSVHNKFQASQGHMMRLFLMKKQINPPNTHTRGIRKAQSSEVDRAIMKYSIYIAEIWSQKRKRFWYMLQ